MNKIYDVFLNYAKNNFKRNLSWLDRDIDSPTYGSFDRNYWHYKITDFNSDILQQGIYTLISLYKGHIPNNYDKSKIKELILSATTFVIKSFKKNNLFNEYYPNEDGYPPKAFTSNLLGDIFNEFPDFINLPDFKDVYKRININLSKLSEINASNQYAIGVSGLYKFLKIFPDLGNQININFHTDNLIKLQDIKEGWLNEYDGFDLGYLSVTLEALSEIYEISKNKRIKDSINLIIDFIYNVIDKKGQLPFTINSRNTEYLLPYGLVKNLSENHKSGTILNLLYENMDDVSHFIKGNDDRYHSHYIFASILKSLPLLKTKLNFKELELVKYAIFDNAGLMKKYIKNFDVTIFIGFLKGGIIRIHDHKNKKILVQNGYRAFKGNNILTNNFQSKDWKFDIKDDIIICEGYFVKTNFIISSPIKHILLRILSYLFGKKIIKYLKRKMIFNKVSKKHFFKRKISFDDGIVIEDTFEGFKGYQLKINPKQNLRHVASADIFSDEDFTEDIIKLNFNLIKENKFKIINQYKFN
tara:strand:- start:1372 stop:2955 length:1584 start_codon:yes stop_codon:yes gene_type:complete